MQLKIYNYLIIYILSKNPTLGYWINNLSFPRALFTLA